MTEKPVMQVRRGMKKYRSNPFVDGTCMRQGVRKISNPAGDKLMVVSGETGEIVGPAGFWQTQEVDKSQFVKLYVNGVRAFKELTGAGAKVFEILFIEMQKNIGKDKIYLTFQSINQEVSPMSEATFYRGLRELTQKKFIADCVEPGMFFINPDYLWNGDRMAFVKEFRVKRSKGEIERDTLTGDLFEALEGKGESNGKGN